MDIPNHLKFTIGGFSAHRVAYILSFLSFAFVPFHNRVSCETSGAIAGIGILLLIITAVLCFVTRRSTPHRFRPLAFALFAMLAHALCTH